MSSTRGRKGVSRIVIAAIALIGVLAISSAYYINNANATSKNSVTINIMVTDGTPQNGAPDEFFPHYFTVTEGQHVTIVFDNTDDDPHELAIPAFGVNTGVVPSGVTTRVSFVPNQVGVFPYYEPPGLCGNCTGAQETWGNMTVLAS
ncbi:MAG TPA: cupredoxin domain-containing protein [Nitrososphaerales archaeon]|nr:cupredoxin domain-containing protein [Nitrososphaerales archaeon]